MLRPKMIPIAELDGVCKSYGKTPVLRDFSLSLNPGEVTALLGPNGAGKSTIAGVLTGRVASDKGVVHLFGRAPRDTEARARMGVMLQTAGLPETLTVAEAVALQTGYFKRGLKLADTLAQAGLTALAKRRCDQLSGGQQRAVQFAMAICGAPDLLVLDEPTSGLDSDARRRVWSVVRGVTDAGAGVLLTTHHLDEAEALADRIVVFADGRILADGSPAQIRAQVAGASIRCRTGVASAQALAFPGSKRVTQNGADTIILSADPRATLEALFLADPLMSAFTVETASLEEALGDIAAKAVREVA